MIRLYENRFLLAHELVVSLPVEHSVELHHVRISNGKFIACAIQAEKSDCVSFLGHLSRHRRFHDIRQSSSV
jgi:hypothetical protein